jgi:hypothetical protein
MVTSPPAVIRNESRSPRRMKVIGAIFICISLLGFLFTSYASFKSVAAPDTYSFTIIEDQAGATGGNFPFEHLTREEYEREKQDIIIMAERSGNKIGAGKDDAWLWVRVKTALIQTGEIAASGVNVDVEQGVVVLTGSVSDAEQKERVESAAKGIEGVRRVINKLSIVAGHDDSPKADDQRFVPDATPFRKVQSQKREVQTKIEVEWPREMNLTDKGVARVSITPDAEASATPIAELPNNEASILDPTRCNTPNANLRNAYGAQYEASALANLTATAFNVTPNQTGAKPLSQAKVTFTWDIEPKGGGAQAITLLVSAQWKHKRNNQTKPPCEIINRSFPVAVKESIISTGNLGKASAVLAVIGVAFALPIFPWNKKGDKGKDEDK